VQRERAGIAEPSVRESDLSRGLGPPGEIHHEQKVECEAEPGLGPPEHSESERRHSRSDGNGPPGGISKEGGRSCYDECHCRQEPQDTDRSDADRSEICCTSQDGSAVRYPGWGCMPPRHEEAREMGYSVHEKEKRES
jgi:hypothetical protein